MDDNWKDSISDERPIERKPTWKLQTNHMSTTYVEDIDWNNSRITKNLSYRHKKLCLIIKQEI